MVYIIASIHLFILVLPVINITVFQDAKSIIMNCTFESYGTFISIAWEHNDTQLDLSSEAVTVNIQSNYSELIISPLTHNHIGQYQCIVTNSAGSVKSGKVVVAIYQLGLFVSIFI